MSQVVEQTIPAEAELGLRSLSVTLADGSRVTVQVMHEIPDDECSGEIHPTPPSLLLSRDVVANEPLGVALVQIAAELLRHPRSRSLPAA